MRQSWPSSGRFLEAPPCRARASRGVLLPKGEGHALHFFANLDNRGLGPPTLSHIAGGHRPPLQSVSSLQFLMVAGEASGDMYGADVARALFRRFPDCKIYGLGGARMSAAGVELEGDISK